MKTLTTALAIIAVTFNGASAFTSSPVISSSASAVANTNRCTNLYAGGWGNNQERSVFDEEQGGDSVYANYEIEDRGKFMQRVNEERKSLRIKKAADLLEVARIAGVELKKKTKDPEKLDLFDADDFESDEDYLDVSV